MPCSSGAAGPATNWAPRKRCGSRMQPHRRRYHRRDIMQNQTQSQTQSKPLAFGLTILSALGRLLPHAPNVTPVGGACLFAGSRIAGFWAYLLPLAVMIATDPIVGHAGGARSGYSWSSPVIYACFMINIVIGRRMLRNVTPFRVGLAAFLCSLQFFVLTNLAVWVE